MFCVILAQSTVISPDIANLLHSMRLLSIFSFQSFASGTNTKILKLANFTIKIYLPKPKPPNSPKSLFLGRPKRLNLVWWRTLRGAFALWSHNLCFFGSLADCHCFTLFPPFYDLFLPVLYYFSFLTAFFVLIESNFTPSFLAQDIGSSSSSSWVDFWPTTLFWFPWTKRTRFLLKSERFKKKNEDVLILLSKRLSMKPRAKPRRKLSTSKVIIVYLFSTVEQVFTFLLHHECWNWLFLIVIFINPNII